MIEYAIDYVRIAAGLGCLFCLFVAWWVWREAKATGRDVTLEDLEELQERVR